MTEKKIRANWFGGFIAAVMMSVTFGLIWDDWYLGLAIGVVVGITAAFVFAPRKRE